MRGTSRISLNYLAYAVTTRWRTALLVGVLLFAGLALYVKSLEPAYTSTALVLLAPAAEELGDHSGATVDPLFIRSETTILSDDQLSRAVIERLKLWTLPEFLPKPGLLQRWGLYREQTSHSVLSPKEVLLDQIVREYGRRLTVFNDGRSKTVEISFTASEPRTAAAIANAHADAYLLEQSTRRLDSQERAIQWLAREVDARATEVHDADAEVQQYRLKHGIVSTNDATMVEQRLSQVSTQLGEARRQLSTQKTLLQEIERVRAGGDPGNAAALLDDAAMQNLLASRVQSEANIASLEKHLAANNPKLVQARQELVGINNTLNIELKRLESQARASASWWQRQVDDLDRTVSNETSLKTNQDRVAAGLPALLSQAEVKRTVFETVMNRYQTLLAERAVLEPAASIVSRAMPSARPSFPRTVLFLTIAAMASLLGAAAAAVGWHMVRSASLDLTGTAAELGIRPLVAIPRFRSTRSQGVVQMRDPRLFVESVRFLRDAVFGRSSAGQMAVCLVTSVLPRQGKSLTAMSLARAMARSGRRTLFMEADLRQPTGSKLARCDPPEKGLAAVLEGRASINEVVLQDESTGLHMLLAEEDASKALERLAATEVRQLLEKLRARYDAIVIDSPPVGIVSDALTLALLADQTILVAREGACTVQDLKRGLSMLRDRGAIIAGLVLTSVDPAEMSSVDRKTLDRYVKGVPAVRRVENVVGR